MEKPGFQSKGDFLTILLENDFFNKNDSMIIDECAVFMVAATQTTTVMMYNALYFLITNPEKLQICRQEVSKYLDKVQVKDKTESEWISHLSYDNL